MAYYQLQEAMTGWLKTAMLRQTALIMLLILALLANVSGVAAAGCGMIVGP